MSIGFRKSLFGFHTGDVMNYIESMHKTYTEKEKDFSEQVGSLNEQLKAKSGELSRIQQENERLARELKDYTDQYEEIERLSQNIGKLYLVAQANARAVMKNSTESRELSRREVEQNMTALEEAHESLDALKEKILRTTNDFAGQVDELLSSLNETRSRIRIADAEADEKSASFEALYSEIAQ